MNKRKPWRCPLCGGGSRGAFRCQCPHWGSKCRDCRKEITAENTPPGKRSRPDVCGACWESRLVAVSTGVSYAEHVAAAKEKP